MLSQNRIILSKNGTLTDFSVTLSDPLNGSALTDIVAAQDAIYLGSDMPFNHRWVEINSVNAIASVITVQLWDGSAWRNAVDVMDQTALSGKSLAQSGLISWTPNQRSFAWTREFSTEDIDELDSLVIYDLYWVKLTFSANLTGTTNLKFVGHKFSKDVDLFAQYPDLRDPQVIKAFKFGKTDWADQTFLAAEYIIQDLREKGVIWGKNQILNPVIFKNASVHKTAEIIYSGFGDDYADNRDEAARQFKKSLENRTYEVDTNANAYLDDAEKPKQSSLTR